MTCGQVAGAALLCVANWVERKGILDLLDAVAGLDDDLLTSHLVGDENVDERFRARVVERLTRPDLMGRVERHGVVEPARVPDYYEGADMFVLPSTEEPYGMVYAEAMVAGLPVVGWRAGNLPNLVDDGVEGRLIPVGDVVALRLGAGDTGRRRRIATSPRRRCPQPCRAVADLGSDSAGVLCELSPRPRGGRLHHPATEVAHDRRRCRVPLTVRRSCS